MKGGSIFLVLVLLSFGAGADTVAGRVVRVIDGDTLVLLMPGDRQERVRLSGIDCPERRQAFGTKAKEALLDRVGGEEVSIEWDKRDRYKRVVGKVISDGQDVNLSLVREGIVNGHENRATGGQQF